MLYGGRALSDWVFAGGNPAHALFAYKARLRWHTHWFEHNWQSQTRSLETLSLPQDPVFIVGPWRSGTTLLHELLAAATDWPTPQTWQCFNPSTCFLVNTPPPQRMMQRPMDAGMIASHGPQEDEFAALLLGEDSVYRGFIDPRRLGSCAALLWRHVDGTSPLAGSDASEPLSRWRLFVQGIAASAGAHRLLLKSPNHTFRIPLLRRWFPRAQFVWMGRSSDGLLASNVRMWRAMIERYALWPAPSNALEEFLHEMVRACTAMLRRCLDDMSPEQLLWVDFERLSSAPRSALRSVLQFLQPELSEPDQEERVSEALRRTPVHPGARTAAAAPAADAAQLDMLMQAARARFGTDVARRKDSR